MSQTDSSKFVAQWCVSGFNINIIIGRHFEMNKENWLVCFPVVYRTKQHSTNILFSSETQTDRQTAMTFFIKRMRVLGLFRS